MRNFMLLGTVQPGILEEHELLHISANSFLTLVVNLMSYNGGLQLIVVDQRFQTSGTMHRS